MSGSHVRKEENDQQKTQVNDFSKFTGSAGGKSTPAFWWRILRSFNQAQFCTNV